MCDKARKCFLSAEEGMREFVVFVSVSRWCDERRNREDGEG